MTAQFDDILRNAKSMADEELVSAVTVQRDDFTDEAIGIFDAEIERRGGLQSVKQSLLDSNGQNTLLDGTHSEMDNSKNIGGWARDSAMQLTRKARTKTEIDYRKVGGWLSLFYFVLFVGIMRSVISLLQVVMEYTKYNENISLMANETNVYGFTIVFVFQPVALITLLVLSFKTIAAVEKRTFESAFHIVLYLKLSYWIAVADVVLFFPITQFSDYTIMSIFNLVPPLIWIYYFARSVRVKKTFGLNDNDTQFFTKLTDVRSKGGTIQQSNAK